MRFFLSSFPSTGLLLTSSTVLASALQPPGAARCDAPPPPRPSNLQRTTTAIGRFSVISETKAHPSIITFVMGLSGKEPFSAREFVDMWKDRGMPQRHPNFHARLTSDFSRFVQDDSEPPVVDTYFPIVPREDVRRRLLELQMTPWKLTDRLWKIWIAPWGKLGVSGIVPTAPANATGESLLFFQGHHVLGDGASMAAAFLDVVDEGEELRSEVLRVWNKRRKVVRSFWKRVHLFWRRLIWFLVGSFRACMYQTKLHLCLLWEPDPWKTIRSEAEAVGSTSDRTLSWSEVAPLDQAKWIARQLGGGSYTVNDVFCACVTAALSRQLEEHRKRLSISRPEMKVPAQTHMHIALPVHLKGGVVLPGESVGNNLGGFVVRLPGEGQNDPKARLQTVHNELFSVKRTPASYLSHMLARCLSYSSHVLPNRWIASLYRHSSAGALAVVSNNRGAPRHVHLGGRRVESIYGFVPMPPGIPIGVVLMSYAGSVSLSVSAQTWAVSDADQFLAWVLEEYLRLLAAAKNVQKEAL